MTRVRGSKQRTERTTVISDTEFNEALAKADKLESEYFRLRAKAVLSLFRLTGKRRGEVAQVPLGNFKTENGFLNVTFILEKKRKGNVLQKLSTKSLPLSDGLTRHIVAYLVCLNALETRPRYWLPSGRCVFGNYIILPEQHLTGRGVFNIVRGCTKTFWCHLFRETVAADIIRQDSSIIAAFKVQRRLDLESYTTGFNYLRRFASDVIERENLAVS
jgi:integrase